MLDDARSSLGRGEVTDTDCVDAWAPFEAERSRYSAEAHASTLPITDFTPMSVAVNAGGWTCTEDGVLKRVTIGTATLNVYVKATANLAYF